VRLNARVGLVPLKHRSSSNFVGSSHFHVMGIGALILTAAVRSEGRMSHAWSRNIHH
jgi:hypothetical protein